MGVQSFSLPITSMACASCVQSNETAEGSLPGGEQVTVNLAGSEHSKISGWAWKFGSAAEMLHRTLEHVRAGEALPVWSRVLQLLRSA